MQKLPDRGVILVVISGKIITPHTSKIWISVHHGRRFIDCLTLSLQLWASEDQQVSAPNFQLYGAFDKLHEVTLRPEFINNSYLRGMSGEFHDKLGGNHASLYENGRFCKAICMHACITCKKKMRYADARDAHVYLK
jgi:hypothetical protein